MNIVKSRYPAHIQSGARCQNRALIAVIYQNLRVIYYQKINMLCRYTHAKLAQFLDTRVDS